MGDVARQQGRRADDVVGCVRGEGQRDAVVRVRPGGHGRARHLEGLLLCICSGRQRAQPNVDLINVDLINVDLRRLTSIRITIDFFINMEL